MSYCNLKKTVLTLFAAILLFGSIGYASPHKGSMHKSPLRSWAVNDPLPCQKPDNALWLHQDWTNPLGHSSTSSTTATALNFDGVNDNVDCGNPTAVQLNTGTIECWFKTSNAGTSYRQLIGQVNAYALYLKDNVLMMYDFGGGADRSTGINLADNSWHHVAASFVSGNTNGTNIYVDGVLRLTTTITVHDHTAYNFTIGNGASNAFAFNGSIDEARVWSTIRSASDIANNRNCELSGTQTGLVAYYNFNEGADNSSNSGVTSLIDASGNGINGTLSNFALSGSTSNWVAGNSPVNTALTTPTINNSGATACIGTAALSLSWATSPIGGINWYNGGVLANTATGSYATSGITVAGGNGLGSNLNQLNPGGDAWVDALGNVYVVDYNDSRVVKWAPGATVGTVVAGGNGAGNAANQLNGPLGITGDAYNNLYIVDFNNNRIQKWASGATTGTTIAGGNGSGSGATQFNNPYGICLDGNNNLYVADYGNGRVQKFTSGSTGSTAGTTVAGTGKGSGATQMGPVGVFVDASNNLYVCDFDNHRITKWASGASSGTIVAGGNGAGSAANQLKNPFSIWVDGGNNILVADAGNNRVQEFLNGSTTGITVAGQSNGTSGTGANFLNNPSGLMLDIYGNLYVADQNNNRVQKFNLTATNSYTPSSIGSYSALATNGAGCSAISGNTFSILSVPNAITIGNSGTACTGSASLTVSGASASNTLGWYQNGTLVNTATTTYGTNGSIVAGNGSSGSSSSQLNNPNGVCTDASGNVYVADYANNRVQKWAVGASSGTTVAGGNGSGSAANQLNGPVGICLDASNNLYVADLNNNRIQKFASGSTSSTNATTVAGGQGQGSLATQLNQPRAVYVDASGNIYVVDNGNSRIQRFPSNSTSGTSATTFAGGNGSGTGATQFNYPVDVKGDGSGNIYISDAGNSRIQRFPSNSTSTTAATTVAGGNGAGTAANQLHTPSGIFIDGSSNLYVVDQYNARVQKFASGSTNATTLAGNNGVGSGLNQLSSPSYVAVDAFSNIYIADNNNNRVLEFSLGYNTPYMPTNAGIYTAVTTNAGGCTTTSNAITINATVTPSIAIAAFPTGAVCAGTTVTFTATPTNGGASPVFQWFKGGVAISGATNSTYSYTPANSDAITCQLTSNATCASPTMVTSPSLTMTVNATVTPSISIAASANNVTSGTSVTFTATATNGGASPTYQWTKGGVNISGATSSAYIYTPANGDVIACVLSSNAACASPSTVTSSSVTMVVNSCFTYTQSNLTATGSQFASTATFTPAALYNGYQQWTATYEGFTYNVQWNGFEWIIVRSDGSSIAYNTTGSTTYLPGSNWTSFTTFGSVTLTGGIGSLVGTNTSSTTNETVCSSQLPYTWNGTAYSTVGTYTKTLVNSIGCDSVATLVLTLKSSSTSSTSVTNCGSYTWNGTTYTSSGTYTKTGLTNAAGCDSTATLVLTINPAPTATITGSATGCGSVTLTASGGTSYSWNGGNSTTTAANSFTNNGTYSVTVTNANGCSATASQAVTVNPNPTVTLSNTGATACVGMANLTLSGASAASSITWYNGSTQTATAPYQLSNNPTTSIVAGGNGFGSAANQLGNPFQIAFDASGNMYVADVFNNRIQKFPAGSTSATNGVTFAGGNGSGSAANQLGHPNSVFVDAAGYLYVADNANNRIQKFPPNSTSATNGVTVAGGNGGGSAANQIANPNDVAVDASGNIYVVDYNNNRIQKFPSNSTSSTAGVTVAGGNGLGNAANKFSFPTTLALDGSGNIYVVDQQNFRVQKFPPNGSSSTNGVTIASGFSYPNGVAVDAAGNILVSDITDKAVYMFPAGTTNATKASGTKILTSTILSYPNGLCFDTKGNLYVADQGKEAIIKADATLITTSYTPSSSGSYTAVVTNSSGCSTTSNAVVVNALPTAIITGTTTGCGSVNLTASGGTSYSWNGGNSTITAANSFTTSGTYTVTATDANGCTATASQAVTVNPNPTVTLSNTGTTTCVGTANLLATTTTTLEDLVWYNSSSLANSASVSGGNVGLTVVTSLSNPSTLARDANNNLFVTDLTNNRILKFVNGTGSAIVAAGGNGNGSGATQLKIPVSVAVDLLGNIYVADQGNKRIQKFAAGSTGSTSATTVAALQLTTPQSVFVDASGNVYVLDIGSSKVYKYTAGSTSTTAPSVVLSYSTGSGAAQLNSPVGIQVDATGNIYINDQSNNRIQKYLVSTAAFTTVAGGNGSGSALNQFNSPEGFYVDSIGGIYVADALNYRILFFKPGSTNSSSGYVVAGGRGPGFGNNVIGYPKSVLLDASGNIYCLDYAFSRIQKWPAITVANTYVPLTTGSYTATAINKYGCQASSSAINVGVVPTLSIVADKTSICTGLGNAVNFTSTQMNGGTNPTYQWYRNGFNIGGATSNTYSSTTLANNDVVLCKLTSSQSCVGVVSSNSVAIIGNPLVAPSVSITVSQKNNICAGATDTLTATVTNGGTTPVYQWKLGSTTITGFSPTISYVPTSGDVVNCTLTSNASCLSTFTAVSNSITLTGTTPPTVTPVSTCAGSSVTLQGSSANTVKWYTTATDGTALTSNVVTPNATTSYYAEANSGKPTSLGNTFFYHTHSVQTFTVPQGVTSLHIIANGAGGKNFGGSGSQVVTDLKVTPGTILNVYVGGNNGDNGGGIGTYYNGGGASDIRIGGTSLSNRIIVAGGGGAGRDRNSFGGYGGFTKTDAFGTNAAKGGTAFGGGAAGDAQSTNGSLGQGGNGDWAGGGGGYYGGGGGYSGGGGSSFTYPTLCSGTFSQPGSNSDGTVQISWTVPATTCASPRVPVVVSVTPQVTPTITVAASTTTLCSGTPVTFTANTTNGGSSPTYIWTKNGRTVGGNSSSYSDATLNNGDVLSSTLLSNASCLTTSRANSNSITVKVNSPTKSTDSVRLNISQLPYTWNGSNYNASGTYTKTLTGSKGCDSIATLNLNVWQPLRDTVSTTVCTGQLPYVWNQTAYTSTGKYNYTVSNYQGRDSITTLLLTVKASTSSTFNESICSSALPYTWNGKTYNTSGTYTVTTTNTVGCDSVQTLVLTVKSSSSSTTNLSICAASLPYLWNGIYYTQAGNYTYTTTNSVGCDSVATLILKVAQPSSSTTTVRLCSPSLPYLWNGTVYYQGGTYYDTLTNAAGCDSIATLVLKVSDVSSSTIYDTICQGNSFNWNGKAYTTSGNYTFTSTNAAGCDSTSTLQLTVNPITTDTTFAILTDSLPVVFWNSNGYNTAGTYVLHLTNSNGCDSLDVLVITAQQANASTTNLSICTSQTPYSWNSQSLSTSGTYTATLTNQYGADSIATLNLTVNAASAYSYSQSICAGDTANLNGVNHTTAGTYTATLQNAVGCDSVVTLHLTVAQPTSSSTTKTLCADAVPYAWNGGFYSTSGTYTAHFVNAQGCDSTATLVLTVNTLPSATITGSPVGCGSASLTATGGSTYNWNGGNSTNTATNTFSNTGFYTVTVTDVNGCAATASQYVGVFPTATASISGPTTGCGSITLTASGGNIYNWSAGNSTHTSSNTITQSGTYTVTVVNATGCVASASKTVTVNALPTAFIPVQSASACGPVTLTATGGNSYSWNGGNNPNSATNTFTTTGSYTVTVTNAAGCTETAIQTVTVKEIPTATITGNSTGCGDVVLIANGGLSYVWSGGKANNGADTITQSGTYSVTVTDQAGCTAIASKTVTVTPNDTATVSIAITTGSQVITTGTSVTFTATSANYGSSTTYQWQKNGTNIAGATSITYTDANLANGDKINVVITNSAPCAVNPTVTSNVIQIATSTADFTWLGTVSSDWNNAANWSNNVLPTATSVVTIPSSAAHQPVLSGPVTISGASLDGSIALNGKALTITGTLSGTVKIIGDQAATLTVGNAGSISFDPTANNLGTLNVTGNTTLGSKLNLYGLLNLTSGTLTTGDNLTLKSTSIQNTAEVGPVTGNISGKVTVERFIPQGLREFRDLGPSVANAGSIFNNWQEAGNYSNGYGIMITGSTGSATGYDPNTGLDYTQTGFHSMYTYKDGNWDSIKNTMTTNLDPYQGYRSLVRGNRAINLFTNPQPTAMLTPATIRSTGNLVTGTVSYTTTGITGSYNSSYHLTTGDSAFSFLANPYVCPIDWTKIWTRSTNITNSYYYVEPTFVANGYITYVTYNAELNTSSNPMGSQLNQYIQPGQAFFVQTGSGTPVLNIQEDDKVTGKTHTAIFSAPQPVNRIAVGLNRGKNNVDGTVSAFSSNLSNGNHSSQKFDNAGENIAFKQSGNDVSIASEQLPTASTILPIHLYGMRTGTAYSLRLSVADFIGNGLVAYLNDRKTATLTKLVGDSTIVNFTATADTATYASRFSIVFRSTVLPIENICLVAKAIVEKVELNWTVVGVDNVTSYVVERNTGNGFVPLATVGAGTFAYTDVSPVEGCNSYRVKTVSKDGSVTYSQVATASIGSMVASVGIYPNPLVGKTLSIRLYNLEKGEYTLSLVDKLGRVAASRPLIHNGSTNAQQVNLTNGLAAGSYTMRVVSANGLTVQAQLEVQ